MYIAKKLNKQEVGEAFSRGAKSEHHETQQAAWSDLRRWNPRTHAIRTHMAQPKIAQARAHPKLVITSIIRGATL